MVFLHLGGHCSQAEVLIDKIAHSYAERRNVSVSYASSRLRDHLAISVATAQANAILYRGVQAGCLLSHYDPSDTKDFKALFTLPSSNYNIV